MSKTRRAVKPMPVKTQIPFTSAEEAWFWFVQSERARRDGARLSEEASDTARPCDPDDIYRALMRLHRAGRVGARHLKVLAAYGWRGSSPDKRVEEESADLALWEDGLDRLTTSLVERGIVICPTHDEGGGDASDDERSMQRRAARCG